MPTLQREPIGLRVVIRALRPEDREPFLLWRADPQPELDALLTHGEQEDRAWLWASLLRWSEAEAVATHMSGSGWICTLRGVRALVLDRAVSVLNAPTGDEGWTFSAGGIMVRALPEAPTGDDESLARLLAFLDP